MYFFNNRICRARWIVTELTFFSIPARLEQLLVRQRQAARALPQYHAPNLVHIPLGKSSLRAAQGVGAQSLLGALKVGGRACCGSSNTSSGRSGCWRWGGRGRRRGSIASRGEGAGRMGCISSDAASSWVSRVEEPGWKAIVAGISEREGIFRIMKQEISMIDSGRVKMRWINRCNVAVLLIMTHLCRSWSVEGFFGPLRAFVLSSVISSQAKHLQTNSFPVSRQYSRRISRAYSYLPN